MPSILFQGIFIPQCSAKNSKFPKPYSGKTRKHAEISFMQDITVFIHFGQIFVNIFDKTVIYFEPLFQKFSSEQFKKPILKKYV